MTRVLLTANKLSKWRLLRQYDSDVCYAVVQRFHLPYSLSLTTRDAYTVVYYVGLKFLHAVLHRTGWNGFRLCGKTQKSTQIRRIQRQTVTESSCLL